jgi:hypothetical protein
MKTSQLFDRSYMNNYFVYDGATLVAAQSSFKSALKYFRKGRKLIKGTPFNHTFDLTKIAEKLLFIEPTVIRLNNGQYAVSLGNLRLVQTVINGEKFNDCSIVHADYVETVSSNDERFKPLFIALHNFKN